MRAEHEVNVTIQFAHHTSAFPRLCTEIRGPALYRMSVRLQGTPRKCLRWSVRLSVLPRYLPYLVWLSLVPISVAETDNTWYLQLHGRDTTHLGDLDVAWLVRPCRDIICRDVDRRGRSRTASPMYGLRQTGIGWRSPFSAPNMTRCAKSCVVKLGFDDPRVGTMVGTYSVSQLQMVWGQITKGLGKSADISKAPYVSTPSAIAV